MTGRWDVVVAGAGPAGCAAASLFARRGLRVLLVEKSVAPRPKVCGEFLSPGCLPLLERQDVLRPLLTAGARPLFGMRIHTASGRTLRAAYPGATGAARESLYGLSILRSRLDPLLLDAARAQGVAFQPGFQVGDLCWEGGHVVGLRGRLDGRPCDLSAGLVVGADGRNSVVARRLGAVRRHPWLDKLALVGYFEDVVRAEDAGEIFLGRGRYAILNPVGPDQTNLGLVMDRKDGDPGADPARALLSAARGLGGLGERLASAIPQGPVRCLAPLAHRATRPAAPGALLVGDAAGFLDPFTGEGIYAALRSAELAVESALPGLAGRAPAASAAAAYAAAWSREFLPKWRLATGLQHAIHRPAVAEWLVARLRARPGLTALLMAAVGDLIPGPDLRPWPLLTRLVARGGGAPAAGWAAPTEGLPSLPTPE